MATYNGERYLRQQLESILSQLSEQEAEVIIADDGSTDETLQIVESLKDSRIRVLPAENHLGTIYNYERALQAAKGDVVFLADQDDVWLPGKVTAVLDKLKECDLVMHDAYMLCQTDLQEGDWQRSEKLSDIRPYESGVVCNWWKNSFTGCCMAFRRNVLDKALPFPGNLPMHDQWLGIVAEKYFKVRWIGEPLVEYRQHSSNATHIGNSPAGVLQKIKWRVDLACAILRR
jgi:glycosyltransferase involved in cell wall biosynthesis